jgi:hypothetical protein
MGSRSRFNAAVPWRKVEFPKYLRTILVAAFKPFCANLKPRGAHAKHGNIANSNSDK